MNSNGWRSFGDGSPYEIKVGIALPSPGGGLGSFCIHAFAIWGLLSLHVAPATPREARPPRDASPTVLRVGDKLYFVSQLPINRETMEAPKLPKPAPVAKKLPEPVQVASAEMHEIPKAQAPKVFAPPEVK